MADKKKLGDVFKTVGLPPYTYVKPAYYGEVRADISQPGKHLLIEGPSGIGKTCVAFKVFEELGWAKDDRFSYVSCRDNDGPSRIDAVTFGNNWIRTTVTRTGHPIRST
jgi:hypothetical protein